jgi:hypothetical protein
MSHLTAADLVEYWTADLDEHATAAIEDHVFGCEACTREMARIQRVVAVFRGAVPPVISVEQLAELRKAGLALEENAFMPGTRTPVTFRAGVDVMIHHLAGLSLRDAARVSVTVRSESKGIVMHEDPLAPFDRERGEVLIACQKHFAALPTDIVFDVRVYRDADVELATYSIPHQFV